MFRSAVVSQIRSDRPWSQLILLAALCLAPACAPSNGDNGNDNGNSNGNTNGNTNGNDNSNTNDNTTPDEPGPGQIFVEFNLDPATTTLAQALGGDDTQYGFFGDKNADGTPAGLNQIDVILPTFIAVRISLDDSDRPSQMLASDDSALILSYNASGTQVTAVYVAPSGMTSSLTAMLSSDSARAAQQASPDFDVVCQDLAALADTRSSIFELCDGQPQTPFCTGVIADAIEALAVFCDFELIIVEDVLPSSVGRGPALEIPLGVVVSLSSDSVQPDTGITMRGTVFGGMPPYLFNWALLEDSASQPVITATSTGTISTASFNPVTEGVYFIRLTIFDYLGESAWFDDQAVVVTEPGALRVEAVAEPSADSDFQVILIATATGGAPPYTYSWSVVDGPGEVTFEDSSDMRTEATFSAGGNYILEVAAQDALGTTASDSLPVSIFDPQTSFAVQVVFPPCAQPTTQDTCVGRNGGVIPLSASVNNESSEAALVYEWEIIDGSSSAQLTNANQPIAMLTTLPSGLDTVTVLLTVTDQATSQVATAEVTVEIIQNVDLEVVILTDADAILNQPELVLSVVTGVVGELTYAWTVTPGSSGTFDDAAAQNVLFTPTDRPAAGQTLEVRVTVTDVANNQTATDTANLSVSTFPVSISGPDSLIRNALGTYSAVLSSAAPENVTYKWTATKEDAQDSLSLTLLSSTQSFTQIVADGDGVFYLTLQVTDPSDAENVSTATRAIRVTCAEADIPGAVDAGPAQLAGVSQTVTLNCDSEQGGTIVWRSLNDVIADSALAVVPNDPTSVTFTMPGSAALGLAPLEFDCRRSLGTSPPQCEPSDTTLVYAKPVVSPTADSQNKTVAPNVFVTLRCNQTSGSTAQFIDWRQVDSAGAEVSPPTVPGFAEDLFTGTLTFSAPATPQVVLFECRGIIDGPDGELVGDFNTTTRARVTVQAP